MKKSKRRLSVFRPWNVLVAVIAFGIVFYITKNGIRIPEIDIPVKYYFIIGIIASLGMLAYFIRRVMRYVKSYKWETATATIVSSRVNKIDDYSDSGAAYEPKISYRYTVGVKEYISGQIHPTEGWVSSFSFFAEKLVAKYPEGKTVKIFYDPEKPDRSFLERGMFFPNLGFIFMAVLTLVISILVMMDIIEI